jgi:hypothetical protein
VQSATFVDEQVNPDVLSLQTPLQQGTIVEQVCPSVLQAGTSQKQFVLDVPQEIRFSNASSV